jgi:hypothetical protein
MTAYCYSAFLIEYDSNSFQSDLKPKKAGRHLMIAPWKTKATGCKLMHGINYILTGKLLEESRDRSLISFYKRNRDLLSGIISYLIVRILLWFIIGLV